MQDQALSESKPQNNNIKAERGNGSGDIAHNFAFSMLCDIPMGDGHSFLGTWPAPLRMLVTGWQFTGLGLSHSGITYTVYIGTKTYGNQSYINQRPNANPGLSFYAADKTWRSWLNLNAWALPVSGGFRNSRRNTIYGATFKQIDTSVIKETPLTARESIEFRVELFKVFNHPNFAQPNTTFGTEGSGQTFNTFGTTLGLGTARQIQAGLKFNF